MRESILIGFHAIACLQFAYSVYYDYTYTVVPQNVMKVHGAFGGRFKFLTFWDAILQAVFFFICIVNDWYGTNAVSPKKPPFVRKLKDYVYATLSFPMAMFVGITFWSIMCVDRELVLPKALDPYFPWWLNHLMHTMIMVSAVIEMLLAPRKYPKRSRGLAGLLAFTLTYLIWMHVIYFMSGIWVYPVMEVLTPPLRIVFFVVLLAFVLILYFAGEMLNNLVWDTEPVVPPTSAPLLVTSFGKAAAQVELKSCEATELRSKFNPTGSSLISSDRINIDKNYIITYRRRNLVHVSTVDPVQTHDDISIPAKNGEKLALSDIISWLLIFKRISVINPTINEAMSIHFLMKYYFDMFLSLLQLILTHKNIRSMDDKSTLFL